MWFPEIISIYIYISFFLEGGVGPCNKDYNIFGSILGSYFGKLPDTNYIPLLPIKNQ